MDPVRYDVRFPAPETHLVELTARFPAEACDGDALVVSMPVWTPGSYLVREFARLVEGMRASDEAGAPLACSTGQASWRIARPASGAIVLSWRVYARELTVRTSYLDAELASLNGANLFLTAERVARLPCEVSFELRAGQRLVTTLPPGGAPGHFVARDFDQLCDCPVLIGELSVLEFSAAPGTARGRGRHRRPAAPRSRSAKAGRLFGGLPTSATPSSSC
jgi:predicted metalloprotease with PDZ domain